MASADLNWLHISAIGFVGAGGAYIIGREYGILKLNDLLAMAIYSSIITPSICLFLELIMFDYLLIQHLEL